MGATGTTAIVAMVLGVVVALVVGIIVWSTAGGGSDPATFEFEGEQVPCHTDDMAEDEAEDWAVRFALEEEFAQAWAEGCGEDS